MSGAKILLFCRLSLFTKYHKMFKIAVSFSGGVLETKRGCVISHIPYALKGQKLLAQGIALGFRINTTRSP